LNILDSPPFPSPGTHAGALDVERSDREGETWVGRASRFVGRACSVVTLIEDLPDFLELFGVTAPP
jgi:hypothetical protein